MNIYYFKSNYYYFSTFLYIIYVPTMIIRWGFSFYIILQTSTLDPNILYENIVQLLIFMIL